MSLKSFSFGVLIIILLVTGLYQAKNHARVSGEEIVHLETELAKAYKQKSLLQAEYAHMSRREWIEDYARQHLGMGPAKAHQFVDKYTLDLLIGAPETGVSGALAALSSPDLQARPAASRPIATPARYAYDDPSRRSD